MDVTKLRRGRGAHWERVFRGTGPGEVDGRYWTPDPLAALTFVECDGGRLLIGTLRLRGLVICKLDDWARDTQHPGDSPPPQDGTDIQCYIDSAKQQILWHPGEKRRICVGEAYGPEVRRVGSCRFTAYRLVSEKAIQSLRQTHSFRYSNELIAEVLTRIDNQRRW